MPSSVNTSSLPLTRAYLRSTEGRVVMALAATALMAFCAHVSVPLPFTPVPLTLQTFGVLLIGFLLGPTAGFFSLLAYLMEGICGLPVFSPSVHGGGIAQLIGPTGGYLMSYPFAAAIAGYAAKALPLKRLPGLSYALAGTLATIFIFFCGTAWLVALTRLPASTAWMAAIVPFLPGEVIKIGAAAGIARTLRHYLHD